MFENEVKEMAWRLLDKGMVDFIGSDMHNLSHAQHIYNYIGCKEYRKLSEKAAGILNNKIQF